MTDFIQKNGNNAVPKTILVLENRVDFNGKSNQLIFNQ